MKRHFTTTVYLLTDDKVLLLFHPKLKKWLPPGGHIKPNESPPMAARREVFEETGLEFIFINEENIWVERWNAKSFERPYMCLMEEIPEHNGTAAHQHMDFIYLGKPIGKIAPVSEDPIQWFTYDEIEAFKDDEEIFVETKEVLRTLLPTEVLL